MVENNSFSCIFCHFNYGEEHMRPQMTMSFSENSAWFLPLFVFMQLNSNQRKRTSKYYSISFIIKTFFGWHYQASYNQCNCLLWHHTGIKTSHKGIWKYQDLALDEYCKKIFSWAVYIAYLTLCFSFEGKFWVNLIDFISKLYVSSFANISFIWNVCWMNLIDFRSKSLV